MARKKVTYIVSRVDKALEFEWVAEHLDPSAFELSFVILGPVKNTMLKQRLDALNIPCIELFLQSKFQYPQLIWNLRKILRGWKPDIVHCHLIDATLIGIFAAKWAGIKYKIYTRHHSNFHHLYAPHAIKYDVWANRNAEAIVAISQNVADLLIHVEHASAQKVHLIPHGFPNETFMEASVDEVNLIKNKYGYTNNYPIVGVVSRYDHWKGIDYIIDAYRELLKEFPNAKLVLANALKGDNVNHIKHKLQQLPSSSYCQIEFEPDNKALFKSFDMFVHVPIDKYAEAFGQVYIEAMAQKVPIIATRSGVGLEVIQHLNTGYEVAFRNSDEILSGIRYYIQNPSMAKLHSNTAFNLVRDHYTLTSKIMHLEKLYQS